VNGVCALHPRWQHDVCLLVSVAQQGPVLSVPHISETCILGLTSPGGQQATFVAALPEAAACLTNHTC